MFRLPIDTTTMGFVAAGVATPVIDFKTGLPKTDENAKPLFAVPVMAMFGGEAEVIDVKTAEEPKGISPGNPVRLVGLTGLPWFIAEDQRFGVAYRATRIEVTRESRSAS